MKRFKNVRHILFDLDGVISNNSDGIIGGVIHAMESFSVEVPSKSELLRFIGPPLKDAFADFCGMSEEVAERAVACYREYYRERGIFENVMYDGVHDMLKAIKESGRKLYLATSKPEEFARRICAHFGIDGYFEYIGGATFDGKRGRKSDVIRYVMDKFDINPSEAVMIGDRHHDVLGAKACGIPCIGVLFGFGDKKELEDSGADIVVSTPQEIAEVII